MRNLGRIAMALVAMSGTCALAATPAHAQAYGDLAPNEVFYCVNPMNTGDCLVAQDAAKWSVSVLVWKFGQRAHHNNMGDAFRHCAWNGAMAQRMGSQRAKRIADNHEKAEGQPRDEKRMDDKNNAAGRSIGVKSNRQGGNDTWGYVLTKCEASARGYRLFGLGGKRGAYPE